MQIVVDFNLSSIYDYIVFYIRFVLSFFFTIASIVESRLRSFGWRAAPSMHIRIATAEWVCNNCDFGSF